MQLYLIRHAESENNANPIHLRVEDPPITATGARQAAILAAHLQDHPIDILITSPVRRALQTTRYIREATGQHVHVWADVFEEGGIYRGHGPEAIEGGPGLSREEVLLHLVEQESQCSLDARITADGWWGCRQRESAEQAIARAGKVVRQLLDRFRPGQNVVMVSHADFKRRLLIEMLGPQQDPHAFTKLSNTGISRLDHDGQQWRLAWLNSVRHLPDDLITSSE